MNANGWAVPFLNKWLAAMPLMLLVACDGTRGNDGAIALATTGFVVIALTLTERLHSKAQTAQRRLLITSMGALVAVIALGFELIIFEKMGALHGPIGVYGWHTSLMIITIVVFVFAGLAALVDHKALDRR